MSRRIGQFYLEYELVEHAFENLNSPEAAQLHAVMTRFTPVHADYQPWNRRIQYVGYSTEFDPVPDAVIAPTYEVTMEKHDGFVGNVACETYEVHFIRVP